MPDAARRYRLRIAIGVILIITGYMVDHSIMRAADAARSDGIAAVQGNLSGSLSSSMRQDQLVENLGHVASEIKLAQSEYVTLVRRGNYIKIVLWIVGLLMLSIGLIGWANRKDDHAPSLP